MLTIKELAATNLARCESVEGFNHALPSWSMLEWAGAMCGEAGEAANVAKKLKRIDQGMSYANRDNDRDRGVLMKKLAKECGDTILYAFLLLQATGHDPEEIIRGVFNDKSVELGCEYRI